MMASVGCLHDTKAYADNDAESREEYNETRKASAKESQQQYDEAIVIYKDLLSKNAKNKKALYGLAICYKKKQNYDEAEKYYKLLTVYYPDDEGSALNLYHFYKKTGKYEKALHEYSRLENIAISKTKTLGHCYYLPWYFSLGRARLHKLLGEYDKALKEYDYFIMCVDNTPPEYKDCKSAQVGDYDDDIILKERNETMRLRDSSQSKERNGAE